MSTARVRGKSFYIGVFRFLRRSIAQTSTRRGQSGTKNGQHGKWPAWKMASTKNGQHEKWVREQLQSATSS
jgi:hypothetical protein